LTEIRHTDAYIVRIIKQLLTYNDFSFFQELRPSAMLDFWGTFWDNPRRILGCLYHYAKFCWKTIL